MENLRCIIADDEPIARQILEKYITEVPYLTLVASCANAFEVLEVLQEESVDILFLDINMPKLSGLSLLKSMRLQPKVIITTAYPEYAVEGFELSVTDYLLKPFSLERFLQAVAKVQQQTATKAPSPQVAPTPTTESLFVKSDKKIIKIELNDITHIEAYGNYIKVFTDSMVLTPQTLTEFLEKLPSKFLRIHKSYVINFDQLKLIDGNQIILQNDTKLPIGKSYRKAVLDRI
ncbi:LytTR family DNA-binding domain-containing protein [uncultured Croceitalea sp.]|uniref:LytR/AlgR family response regulator transcription factor n=1 Tax=uncultured Croceitalea sp. TaxID=1798908 RepID=UPI0033063209